MSEIPRPRRHLSAAGKLYPGAWRAYDQMRADRGRSLPAWPDWCYAPIAVAYAVVSGGGPNRVAPHMIQDVPRLAALAAWRPSQGVYRFDPALYSALVDTPLTGDLPSEALHRLPQWCVYIETPGMQWMDAPLYGFFAHMEWDAGTGRDELRLLLDGEANLTPVPIHVGQWPLSEAVAKALDLSRVHAAALGLPVPDTAQRTVTDSMAPLVSLLLYLCADEAEVGRDGASPTNPVPKRTKQGWRLFAADRTTTWDVGVRIGAALRAASHAHETEQRAIDPNTGRSRPRAHMRRAHWHTFLAGTGRSERRIKWLPPIPVNIHDTDTLPVTVQPVTRTI